MKGFGFGDFELLVLQFDLLRSLQKMLWRQLLHSLGEFFLVSWKFLLNT